MGFLVKPKPALVSHIYAKPYTLDFKCSIEAVCNISITRPGNLSSKPTASGTQDHGYKDLGSCQPNNCPGLLCETM